jgi:hypothetical protein
VTIVSITLYELAVKLAVPDLKAWSAAIYVYTAVAIG